MKKRNLLSIRELSSDEIEELMKLTEELKKGKKVLEGKTLAMIFERPSTRTRVSFEVAMTQLGGHAIYIDLGGSQLSRGESMADTARALSQYVDVALARVYKHEELEEFAKYASMPVINGLSDKEHPCQALGDLVTIRQKGKKKGKVAIVGDPEASVASSLMLACAKAGMEVTAVCPRGYAPKEEYLEETRKSGTDVHVVHEILDGVADADVIYAASWKPGEESEKEERSKAFLPFQLNSKVMGKAGKDCIVMHALPARRGVEITSDVLDSKNSVVWEQAANRLHVQKAILAWLLKQK
ncbi:ornithine carbamoyltransferase [Candidatus Micrarchaeota archaeon]|nr:MAG: ornithine carbamoyltransferase [Candidatus Micrarchaeota archaeon]